MEAWRDEYWRSTLQATLRLLCSITMLSSPAQIHIQCRHYTARRKHDECDHAFMCGSVLGRLYHVPGVEAGSKAWSVIRMHSNFGREDGFLQTTKEEVGVTNVKQ